MDTRTIKLDLSEQAKETFVGGFTSDNFNSSAQNLLTSFDVLYTIFARYDRLIEFDLLSAQGIVTDSQGAVIDYTASHPAAAVAVTALFASIGVVTTYFHLNYLKKIKNNQSTHFIKEELAAAIEAEQAEPAKSVHDINYYLDLVLSDNEDLQKKYEKVKLDGSKLIITYKKPAAAQTEATEPAQNSGWFNSPAWQSAKKSFFKVASVSWETLNLTAFTYWILWIGTGLFTGQFGTGVAGLSPAMGFGIPIAIGLTYPLIKAFRYLKDRYYGKSASAALTDEPAPTPEDNKNGCELMRRALVRRLFEMEKARLQAQLDTYKVKYIPEPVNVANAAENQPASKLDQKILSLGKGKWKKTAVTLIATIGGTFVALQYGAWIISDILNMVANITIGAPIVQLVLGSLMIAAAGIFGIYKAVERFYQVKDHEANQKISVFEQQKLDLKSLENRLEASQKNIAIQEKKLGITPGTDLPRYDEKQFFTDISRRGPTVWTTFKKVCTRALQFLNGGLTGIFLARLFFVKGTAIALPFVAATLSNPITIGILVGAGIAYGAFKFYQFHEQRKEEHAQKLLAEREERIECLKQEVIIAEMREKLYTTRVELRETVEDYSIPSTTVKPEPSYSKIANTTLFGGQPRRYSDSDIPDIDSAPVITPPPKSAA
ncbi:MAG: hypothetical protein V4501_09840 [Pseudomonadota bacterium]